MYFSKNSRYVLRKAKVFTPSLLNEARKKLSMKVPSDDPSKPALRINVPKDASKEEGSNVSDGREARSRSFSSTRGINSNLDNDLMPKAEGDITLSNFMSDDILINSNFDKAPAKSPQQVLEPPRPFYRVNVDPKQEDYDEGLLSCFQEEAKEGAPGDKSGKTGSGVKSASKSEEANADPQSLYIIIDVAEKNEAKSSGANVYDSENEANFSETEKEENRAALERTDTRPKGERQKSHKIRGSKSFPFIKAKPERTKRFEINDIDDAATYVFHLRLNTRLDRPSELGCVPEREITTRHINSNSADTSVKISDAVTKAAVIGTKEVASAEEFSKVSYQDGSKKLKLRRNEENTHSTLQEQERKIVEECRNCHYSQNSHFAIFHEEGIHPPKVKRDNSAWIPSMKKTYPFKMPNKRSEVKPMRRYESQETSATELEAEQQTPKVEIEVDKRDYLNIRDVQGEESTEKIQNKTPPAPSNAQGVAHKKSTKSEPMNTLASSKNEEMKFQTTSNCVSVELEKASSVVPKLCAAFPPLLDAALRSRLNRKDFYLRDPQRVPGTMPDGNARSSKVADLLDNSILFPNKDKSNFDCESLLTTKEDVIMNIIKNAENVSKEAQKGAKTAERCLMESGVKTPPINSLTVMKKVKDMVQFDLDNAVKIFIDGQPTLSPDVDSVMMLKGDAWSVDAEELGRQMEKSAMRMKDVPERQLSGEDTCKNSQPMKYLPPTKENTPEMKLNNDQNSVISYNPQTNEFFLNKEALAEITTSKIDEPLNEVYRTLDFLAKDNQRSMDVKNGDSILVFDDETQSWKVDYSILERREEQMKIEEELTKRSEIILETFEKLEKGQMPTVTLPKTGEKKTFDYKNEQWNTYNPEKKSKQKSKSPFREPDAEEIRKKNSDLYENLFVANKKESKKADGKTAPGLNPAKFPKQSKSMQFSQNKEPSGKGPQTGSTPIGPEAPKEDSKRPPVEKEKPTKHDDNFWESFLKMNILPKDIREIPKTKTPPLIPPKTPSKPTPSLNTPGTTKTPSTSIPVTTKIPSTSIPGTTKTPSTSIPGTTKTPPMNTPPVGTPEIPKKIEEPRFKIRIPFLKDKKLEKADKPVSKGTSKGGKGATQPSDSKSSGKKEAPQGKAPVSEKKVQKKPPVSVPTKDEPGKKQPSVGSTSSPTKNSSSEPPDVKVSPTPKPEIQEPKVTSAPKTEKTASSSEHYVSDKIIEISRNKQNDNQPKIKTNKLETVKLNITSEKRLPSKVTEINLSKKTDESGKEITTKIQNLAETKTPSDGTFKENEQTMKQKNSFYKNFDKYKTPFSEPDFEEKALKIKSDIESNPRLKKLDNWSKTLVLHDIMKPPENIESWLKDETDKMATLLLKVLQEAADGKPKRKALLNKNKSDKLTGKANPYDNIRKKQENTPESFVFRVRTVNLSLDSEKKKQDNMKVAIKSEPLKDVQSEKTKPSNLVDVTNTLKEGTEKAELKASQTALETAVDSAVMPKELTQVSKASLEITDEIPGPEILKKISNTWKVFPILGSQMTIFTLLRVFQLVNLGSSILGSSNPDKSRRQAFTKLFLKYGPIVNVQGPLSGNVILIYSPEHLNGVFEQDISNGVRSIFDSLEHTRRDSEESGLSIGIGISTDWSKLEWSSLKKETIDTLSRGNSRYFGLCDAAGDSLVGTIRKNRNSQNLVSEDFMHEIRRWSLEGLCSIIFEKSFGFLQGRNRENWMMEPDKLYLAIDDATNYLSKCERGFQIWRLTATPSSMGLGRAYRTISSILSKQLYQAEINLKNKAELLKSGSSLPVNDLTFIESMLLNDGMSVEDITCNLVDIILIGTSAMNSAMGFLIYNLAQNIKVQMKLLKELTEALPSKDSPLNYEKLMSMKYLQACLKETLRLNFPIPVFYRLLQNDILLANYIVPKGTFVVMDYRVSSMKEQIFDEPDKFAPERWLEEEQWMHNCHPFGAFPLCHGPRADLAKKVVEMQLMACVAKLIRNFQVEYQYGEIQGTDGIISVPDRPLKLNFIEREV